MSVLNNIRSFFTRRSQKTEILAVANETVTGGVGYTGDYFIDESNKTPNQDNSGINVGTSEEGQLSEVSYGAWASLLQFRAELNPVFFLKSVKKDSLLNRFGVSLGLGIKSEAIKGKKVEKDADGNLKVADSHSTVMSSLKYSLNLLLTGTLIYGVKLGLGVNLLGYNSYGKSRMNKYGRFLVVELSGIVTTFKSINLGLGFIFSDGALFGNLIFGLTQFKRFLVV